jgi:excisionase family DNA binding protein
MTDEGLGPLEALIERLADRVADRLAARLELAPQRGGPNAVRTEEAARLLQLSPTEVRRHLKSGALRSVRVGRVRLIPRAALDEFLERCAS